MSCEQYRDLFDSVFDKEIKEPAKQDLFQHLELCADCNLQYKLYEKLINGVEHLEEPEPPEDLTTDIMKGVSDSLPPWEGHGTFRLPPASWLWFGAFAVTFVLTATTFIGWDATAERRTFLPPIPLNQTLPYEVPHLAVDRQANEPAIAAVPTPTEEPRVLLVRHGGQVEIGDSGSGAYRTAKEEQTLKFGDLVRTGEDGNASLEYRQENVNLRVRPGSLLQVLDAQTLRIYSGNTWVWVRRKGTVFRAQTPNAIASVRGTKYSVEVSPSADTFRESGGKALIAAVEAGRAPTATTNLPAYSTNLGLAVLKRLALMNPSAGVQTEVRVYESTVHVSTWDSGGHESSGVDLGEGFKSKITLASIERPHVLSEEDILPWRNVMAMDPAILERARQSETHHTGEPPHPGPSAGTPEPASESGFDDLHHH